MKFEDMMASLCPKRDAIEIGGYEFFVRPLTIEEFAKTMTGEDKESRGDMMILACVETKDGKPVFESLEQVQSLFTSVRATLYGAINNASFMTQSAHDFEKN